ncbi:MAG: Transcriptional regulator, LysR family [Noviherbaspirillum sp.]|nr:Transcriptional regulator, LysR family [Noviherbaspirillum sp.]
MIDARIKFRHLQCFLLVAEQRSVQKAATALSISQPAVSKTIRELEEILQVRLLERGRRGSALTRQGEIFFEHARASVDALQQGTNSMARARSIASDIIHIGASPSLMASFVPRVLLAFRRQVDDVQLTLFDGTTSHLMAQLRDRKFDLVLCRHSDPEQMVGLSFEFLYADPLVVVMRPDHPLLADPVVEPASLRQYPAILPIKGSIHRHWADTFTADHNIGPFTNFIESLSVSFGRIYTLSSDAIWFVPWSAVQHEVDARVLARLPLAMKGAEKSSGVMARTTGLMMRTNTVFTPAVQLLIDTIREVAAKLRAQAL